jgi:hypothetical protein
VPYGEDFHDVATALAWEEAANRKRPWRAAIFEHFVSLVGDCDRADVRVLELGSRPGFLAEQVLDFRTPSWPTLVGGPFDFVVSLQAAAQAACRAALQPTPIGAGVRRR